MDGMLVNVGAVMGTVHHVERFVARGFSRRIISVLTHASGAVLLVLSCLQFHMHLEILTLRKLHDCPHLCHETCCPAQCPSPDKCTKMLPVINLICHTNSIQGLYSLSMPSLEIGDAMSRGFKLHIVKQALIPKIHLKTILDLNFFLGILLAKVQVVDQELHLCKPKDLEEKVPATKIHSPKHQNRRERLQEQRRPHKMRVCYSSEAKTNFFNCFFVMMACFEAEDAAAMRWLFLIVTLVVTLVAAAYFGNKGLMCSPIGWMKLKSNETENHESNHCQCRHLSRHQVTLLEL